MRNHEINEESRADVVIVGGGVIGLAVARALNDRGVAGVIVVERSQPGGEASYAAGGMLAAQAEADEANGMFELSVLSRALYPEWAASLLNETGIDIHLERTGTLYLAFTERDEEESERRRLWQVTSGLPVERLSGNEVLKQEPGISRHVRSALKFPLDVQVDNRRLITALISSLTRREVPIQTGTEVTSICVENGRIKGVQTPLTTIHAPIVIVANGAWASFLLHSDSPIPAVRIEPVRGQMLCFEPANRIRHVLYSPRGYIVPRLDGRVLAGSTSELVGFEKNVTGEGIFEIMTNALEIAPEVIRHAPLVDSWSGLRPRADDGLPVIGGSADVEGLFFATGHYRNGILLAPLTGELIADEITSGKRPIMSRDFSPDRFHVAAVN